MVAGLGFRRAHFVPAIGALPDVNDLVVEVDVIPSKAPKLHQPSDPILLTTIVINALHFVYRELTNELYCN